MLLLATSIPVLEIDPYTPAVCTAKAFMASLHPKWTPNCNYCCMLEASKRNKAKKNWPSHLMYRVKPEIVSCQAPAGAEMGQEQEEPPI